MKKICLIFVVLFLVSPIIYSQKIYTSQEWYSSTSPSGENNRTASVTDANLNVYVVSNKLMSNNTTDVILTKYSKKGALLWQQTFNGAGNDNDYGVTLALDSSDDVYIAAALTGTTSMDFGLIKYSASGTLVWTNTWNSTNDGIDIPADIDIDTNGNIYLVGGTQASNMLSDYMVIKYNSSGTEQWTHIYDYANLHDAATSIAVVDASTIIVTGASASSISNWDYATLKINSPNGALTSSYRTNVPGVGFDNALGITSDDNNNIYITGYSEANGEKDIQTLKLDDEFGLEWVVTYDNFGTLDDIGKSIVVDDNGNVYVTGSTETATGNDFITIKYNDQGVQQWKAIYGSGQGYDDAESEKIAIADNGVIIAGTVVKDGVNSFMVINYNDIGERKFAKKFNSEHENETVEALSVDGEDIFVSGTSMNNGVPKPITVKYTVVEKTTNYTLSSNGVPIYEANDLIVKVVPSLLKQDIINKTDFQVGKLEDFFVEDAVTDIRAALTGVCGSDKCDITVYKLFRNLTTTLTETTSRMGETIPIPKFWSALLFELPDGVDNELVNVELNSLNSVIQYSEYNLAMQPTNVPNDWWYNQGSQASIHFVDNGPGYEDAHINTEPAWDYEVGREEIKVGVFDSGIRWTHDDFGDGTVDGTKVIDGYDYFTDEHLKDEDASADDFGHGTACAGIIGARRNNSIGIAGIAGGSVADFYPQENMQTGVSLYGMKIFDEDGYLDDDNNWQTVFPLNYVFDAIVETAIDDDEIDLGYGLHISNNSWGTTMGQSSEWDPSFEEVNAGLLKESIEFANRAKVTFVASRGNLFDASISDYQNFVYPANIDDDWILTVSGTALYGLFDPGSLYGINVDVGAPYEASLIRTTGSSNNTSYVPFNGTSASAPHATGVAALLISYLNTDQNTYQNLAPEDVENIIQMTADDTNDWIYPGYDEWLGHGRLDAGDALAQVDKNIYEHVHYGSNNGWTSQLINSNITINLTEDYNRDIFSSIPDDDQFFSAEEDYLVNIYHVSYPYDFHAAQHEDDAIISYWPRHSSSIAFPYIDENNMLLPRVKIEMIEDTETTGLLTGYFYEILDENLETIDWFPAPLVSQFAHFEWTVLYETDALIDASLEEFDNDAFVSISPNPSSDNQTLQFKTVNDSDLVIELYDLEGRRVKDIYKGKLSSGNNNINVSLSTLADGVYIYHITLDEESKQIRVIKQ